DAYELAAFLSNRPVAESLALFERHRSPRIAKLRQRGAFNRFAYLNDSTVAKAPTDGPVIRLQIGIEDVDDLRPISSGDLPPQAPSDRTRFVVA
ncbi:hypothetical protein ACC739_36765, partial [Rhizobium ruizarguesonis]